MKNNSHTHLLLLFVISFFTCRVIYSSESRWKNFDARVARLSKNAANIKVSGTDFNNLIINMEIARSGLDEIDSDTVGDCMNWVGFFYAVHTKRNNSNLSDKEIFDITKTNIYYIFNNESFSFIANYSLKIKAQHQDIWVMNYKKN